MSANKESIGQTLLVAFVLCLVCSVIVSGAAVSLKPVQASNKVLDRKKNILAAAGLFTPGEHGKAEIEEQFQRFQVRMVDLDTGEYLSDAELARPELNPGRYDQFKAAKDPKLSQALVRSVRRNTPVPVPSRPVSSQYTWLAANPASARRSRSSGRDQTRQSYVKARRRLEPSANRKWMWQSNECVTASNRACSQW